MPENQNVSDTEPKTQPRSGDKVLVTLSVEGDEAPIYTAEYAIDDAPEDPTPEHGFKTRLLSESWKSSDLKAFHAVPDQLEKASVKDGIEVSKFVWDFIKDNKPAAKGPGTMTTVLAEGTKPLDYVSAKEGKSREYTLSVKDAWWPHPEYIRVRFRLEGAYAATPAKADVPNGHYLPSVYFNVLECWATWPTWVEAAAEVAGPYDRGSAVSRQPEIKIYGKFHFGWVGSSNNMTCGFSANGMMGMASLGWQ